MEKINLNRAQEIAVFESMENLANYVATLKGKTDTTLYFHFQEIINACFDVNIDNRYSFFDDGDLPKELDIKYKVEGNAVNTLYL